ncbi:hypothetical protein [Streptomyces sp. NPDC048603]|uniref:hypothetical protein n=1 Tax=Streptomyces sp. NPDC048603 TaxID=3365577 RepID=UPI00370FC0A6
MPAVLTRLLLAFLAGAALVLAGPGAAHASQTVEIPAAEPGGISVTARFHSAVVPQAYDPDPTAAYGPRQCQLRYHEYYGTPGCGGFQIGFTLHDLRSRPGYQAGLWAEDRNFDAFADTARTFRCVRPDGGFDPAHNLVVRTSQTPLSATYYMTDSNWVISQHRAYPDQEFGPHFYVNFAPVEVSCPAGTTPTQYGLKVTNLRLTIDDPAVYGHLGWTHPGPFYA